MYIPAFQIVETWKLNPIHSVFSAEIFAILQALHFILKNKLGNCLILSDSKSALQSISNYSKACPNICDEIQTILCKLNKQSHVKIIWVKAHAGIVGNEIADKAANLSHSNNVSTLYNLSLQEKLCTLKKCHRKIWQTNWYNSVEDTRKGKRLRDLRSPHFTTYPVPILLNNRRDEINVFRLRIGHAGLAEYLHRTNQSEDDTCWCGDTENIEHYLFSCSQYDIQRQAIIRSLLSILKPYPTITEKLLLGLDNYSVNTT